MHPIVLAIFCKSQLQLQFLWETSPLIHSYTSSSLSLTSWASIDLFWPLLIVSSKFFQVIFVHLICNSALFLASCCCSFLLHVVANLICTFLVLRQLVRLSTLLKFLHSFCGQEGFTQLFF